MPFAGLAKALLPSLRVYTAASVAILSISVYYAVQVTSDPNWKNNSTQTTQPTFSQAGFQQGDDNHTEDATKQINDTRTLAIHLSETFSFMIQEPCCVWVSLFFN